MSPAECETAARALAALYEASMHALTDLLRPLGRLSVR